jgi:MOSC domain-containing protein YiiM
MKHVIWKRKSKSTAPPAYRENIWTAGIDVNAPGDTEIWMFVI